MTDGGGSKPGLSLDLRDYEDDLRDAHESGEGLDIPVSATITVDGEPHSMRVDTIHFNSLVVSSIVDHHL